VLAGFADDLSAYAQRSLESIGVEVKLGQAVTECTADSVVYGGNRLDTKTIIWAAGVRARPPPNGSARRLTRRPPAGSARPHVPNHPDIFAMAIPLLSTARWQAVPHCAGRQTTGHYVADPSRRA